MAEISKIVGFLALSAVKFLFAPSATIAADYNFLETILITTSGGIAGFLLFYFFGSNIKHWFQRIFNSKPKPVFSKKNRMLAKVKKQYGLIGIAILTPCILSIPLGAILASIYFSEERKTIPIFITAIVLWSIVLTSMTVFLKG